MYYEMIVRPINWTDVGEFARTRSIDLFTINRGTHLFSPQYLPYFPIKCYNVGTQKNHLTETILLSTHNIGLEDQLWMLKHGKLPLCRALNNFKIIPQKCSLGENYVCHGNGNEMEIVQVFLSKSTGPI